MRKIILLSIIFCLSICISGCSYGVSFIIENRSNSEITIKYQTKNLHYGDIIPRTANAGDTNPKTNWEKLSEDKYTIDEETGTVKLVLSPGKAFRIMETDPFWIYHEPYGDHFNIKTLSIKGQNGSIEVEGNQVFEIFEPQKARWAFFGPDVYGYILRYKESPRIEL